MSRNPNSLEARFGQMQREHEDPMAPIEEPAPEQHPAAEVDPGRIASLEAQLGQVRQTAENTSMLQQLLQDPDIARVVALKNQGKPVTFSDGQQAAAPQPPALPENLEEMTNAQLLQLAEQRTAANVLSGVEKLLNQKLEPLGQQTQAMNQKIQQEELRRQELAMKELMSQHPDVKQYAPAMLQLHNAAPWMEPAELYMIAKRRSGTGTAADRRSTETEQPTTHVTRTRQSRSSGTAPAPALGGRRDFRDIVHAAMNDVNLDQLED